METTKRELLEQLRALLMQIRRQTTLAMSLFERWGHPAKEVEDQVLTMLREWRRFADLARHEGIELEREFPKKDLEFVASQLLLLRPPKPAKLPLGVYGFLERFDDVARPAAAPKKSLVNDGLGQFCE